jgi:hypothetical protein
MICATSGLFGLETMATVLEDEVLLVILEVKLYRKPRMDGAFG